MIVKIPADSRGLTQLDWLTSHHAFSFGEYFDPEKMGFGNLRVFNDDTVGGGGGFSPHHHDNMEIVTLVLKGTLEHKDSTGGHGLLKEGQMQRMSAGSGVEHSEFNASKTDPVHFLQIWIKPKQRGLPPEYEQKEFATVLKENAFVTIVSPERKGESLFIHQDVRFYMARLEKDVTVNHNFSSSKHGIYAFVIEGEVHIEDANLKPGDAAMITDVSHLQVKASEPLLLLLIEVVSV